MSILERKLGKNFTIKSMPNYSTAGSYCFFSQCIQLDSLEASNLKDALNTKLDSQESVDAALKVSPLLNHEVKHWYDAHSTLWGLKLLSNIYLRNHEFIETHKLGVGAELNHFTEQMKLKDTIDLIKFPDYYTTRFSDANTTKPWRYAPSFGILFAKDGSPSTRNICFTRFNNSNNELIARVPFSICSLLEASAIAQEINIKLIITNCIKDPVTRSIEIRKLQQETITELYDENLVEYSVVAHKVANSFGIVDVIETYNIATKLTRLVLNLPSELIKKLDPSKLLSNSLQPFFTPYTNALNHLDLGSTFSLLIDALKNRYIDKGTQVTGANIDVLVAETLEYALGINIKQIDQLIKNEISTLLENDYGDKSNYIIPTIQHGLKLYSELGVLGPEFIVIKDIYIPEFILGDGTFCSSNGTMSNDFESRYFEMNKYYEYLQNFAKACIV